MNLNYLVPEPSEDLKKLKPNYDAHNKLMSNLQLCGVFSDKLIERIFSLSWRALDVRIDQYRGKIDNQKADEILNKINVEFQGVFKAYNIFSNEFKTTSFGLFHTVCFYGLN